MKTLIHTPTTIPVNQNKAKWMINTLSSHHLITNSKILINRFLIVSEQKNVIFLYEEITHIRHGHMGIRPSRYT